MFNAQRRTFSHDSSTCVSKVRSQWASPQTALSFCKVSAPTVPPHECLSSLPQSRVHWWQLSFSQGRNQTLVCLLPHELLYSSLDVCFDSLRPHYSPLHIHNRLGPAPCWPTHTLSPPHTLELRISATEVPVLRLSLTALPNSAAPSSDPLSPPPPGTRRGLQQPPSAPSAAIFAPATPAAAMSACARRGGRGKESDGGRCRRGGHFLRAAADPGEGAVPGWSRGDRPRAAQLSENPPPGAEHGSRRLSEGRRLPELIRCKAAEGLVPPGGSGWPRPAEGGVSGCSTVPLRTPSPGSGARRREPVFGEPCEFLLRYLSLGSGREAAARRSFGLRAGELVFNVPGVAFGLFSVSGCLRPWRLKAYCSQSYVKPWLLMHSFAADAN